MDNYSLEDVKNIVNNNLLTSDVLKKILISTSRRIDIYNDYSEIRILKFLKSLDCIDSELKDEIDKYIYKCESFIIESKQIDNKRGNVLILIAIILIIVFIIYIFR